MALKLRWQVENKEFRDSLLVDLSILASTNFNETNSLYDPPIVQSYYKIIGETNDAQVIVNNSQHNYSIRTDSFVLKQWMILAILIVGCLFVFANACILACRQCALDHIKRMLGQDAWSKYKKNVSKDKLNEKSDFENEKVQELSKISVRPDSLNRHINYYVRHPNETLDDSNAGRRGEKVRPSYKMLQTCRAKIV